MPPKRKLPFWNAKSFPILPVLVKEEHDSSDDSDQKLKLARIAKVSRISKQDTAKMTASHSKKRTNKTETKNADGDLQAEAEEQADIDDDEAGECDEEEDKCCSVSHGTSLSTSVSSMASSAAHSSPVSSASSTPSGNPLLSPVQLTASLPMEIAPEHRWPLENYKFALHKEWNDLLQEEVKLMHQRERVAQMRRAMPRFKVNREYEFKVGPDSLLTNDPKSYDTVSLADLFGDAKYLLIAHCMFGERDKQPCGMCAMWADGYSAIAHWIRAASECAFALVAKADLKTVRSYAKKRGWTNIKLVSSGGSTFNADFGAESPDGGQRGTLSVFHKMPDGSIYHTYATSMSMQPFEHRGIDLFTPVWNLMDLLPTGRPLMWYPDNETALLNINRNL